MNAFALSPTAVDPSGDRTQTPKKLPLSAISCCPPVLLRPGVAQLPSVRLEFRFPGSVERSA
jgi:hypothetical protein